MRAGTANNVFTYLLRFRDIDRASQLATGEWVLIFFMTLEPRAELGIDTAPLFLPCDASFWSTDCFLLLAVSCFMCFRDIASASQLATGELL